MEGTSVISHFIASLKELAPKSTPPVVDEREDEIHLRDLAILLLARKWKFLAAAMFGAAAGFCIGQLGPNEFQASSVVQIEKRSEGIELPAEIIGQGVSTGTTLAMATEAHVIRSRLILGPVVEQLNLDWRVEPLRAPLVGHLLERRPVPGLPGDFQPQFIRADEYLELAELEVGDSLVNVRARIRVLDAGRFEARLDERAPVQGVIGQEISLAPGFRFTIAALRAAPGREFTERVNDFETVAFGL